MSANANQKLKALRNSRNITLREVELESRRIADAKGDKRFYISNTRLTQLENDPLSEPSFWKLFTLGTIYQVRITEMMRLYDVDADESDKYYAIASPGKTWLLSEVPGPYRTIESLKTLITAPAKTTLLPRIRPNDDKPDVRTMYTSNQSIGYGYVGLDDFTMYPLIRPGSFVGIDTHQNKLRLIRWRNEYERPIYFVELRDGYACGWCELQENEFLVVPYHSSPTGIRRFTYPQEVEIIGRVVWFTTPCVD
jgi:transcriptional regulator with XRE-family HTH domain